MSSAVLDQRLSTASRADLAGGAVGALLNSPGGKVYELAGDQSWSMAEFAEEVGRQAGKPVAYVNQSEADYAKTLESAGLPSTAAGFLASTSYLAGFGEHDTALLERGPQLRDARHIRDDGNRGEFLGECERVLGDRVDEVGGREVMDVGRVTGLAHRAGRRDVDGGVRQQPVRKIEDRAREPVADRELRALGVLRAAEVYEGLVPRAR